MPEFMPIAMPSDLAGTPTGNTGLNPKATSLMDARMLRKESDEDEDDSDYEHDELLSSENEESDSDFEQLEFTDDDEANEDGEDEAAFAHNTLMSDSDDQSVFSTNSMRTTPSQSPLSSPSRGESAGNDSGQPSPHIRHPLRLKNLGQPGNERMKRVLAALERRIVGKSVGGSTQSSVASANRRVKRKVVSTLVAPLGAEPTSSNGAFHVKITENTQATGSDGDDDWEDGSGDEEFEVVELPSSSDELASASSDEDDENSQRSLTLDLDDSSPKRAASATTTSRREALSNVLPNKKVKLPECPTCGHSNCTCSSSERMQLLLRRMKEKRSSSSLQ